jgi:hypothetical protein
MAGTAEGALRAAETIRRRKAGEEVEAARRVTIPVTADGERIDWERFRRPDLLRKLVSDPEFAAHVGVNGTPLLDTPPAITFDADMVGIAFELVGSISIIVARALGATADEAVMMRWTEHEKTAVSPLLLKTLNKHSGRLGEYQEEWLLGLSVTGVIGGKILTVQRARAAREREAAATATATVGVPPPFGMPS